MSENDGKTIVPSIDDIYMKRKELCKKLYQSKKIFFVFFDKRTLNKTATIYLSLHSTNGNFQIRNNFHGYMGYFGGVK